MSNKPDVYTIRDCYAKVGAVGKLPVSAFQLILKHNAIPVIRADIDPLHKAEWYNSKLPKANPVSVETLVERYVQLQKVVNGPDADRETEFYFDLEVQDPGKGARKQRLQLQGWLLVGVGLSSTSTGALSMTIEIRHPIHRLYETSANFFGMKAEETTAPSTITGAANVYEGIRTCMSEYHKSIQSGHVEPVKNDAEFKVMLKDYQDAMNAVGRHLEWGSTAKGKWPTTPFKNFDKEIKYAMWQYVNATGDSSYWSWLSNSICNDWHVSIIPTYWKEKLEMVPTRFWQPFNLKILDIAIMDFELPPADPMPLKGVYTFCDVPEIGVTTVLDNKEGMQYTLANAAIWAEKVHRSTFMPFRTPAWFNSILSHRGGQFTNLTESGAMLGSGQLTSPMNSSLGQGGLGTPPVGDIRELIQGLKQFCKQQFTEFYRVGMEISLRTNLMIQDDASTWPDNRVTAGMTVRMAPDATFWEAVIPGGAGDPLLDFFVTEVTHMVDCQQAQAYTLFRGAFMREVGGPKNIEAIKNGEAPNYIYE